MPGLVIPPRVADGDFGGWLRDMMAARRISQRVLAMRSGISHSTISRLLRGDRSPSLTTAIAILQVLAPPVRSTDAGEPALRSTDSRNRAA